MSNIYRTLQLGTCSAVEKYIADTTAKSVRFIQSDNKFNVIWSLGDVLHTRTIRGKAIYAIDDAELFDAIEEILNTTNEYFKNKENE